jgi:carotenoid 1,2-hydratase
MIELADALQQTARGCVERAGGFAWWYADIVDDHGNGAVLIWSWGLPFLPGLLDATRKGKAQAAAAWPSLNVAFYRDGKQEYYLLQQFGPTETRWESSDDGADEVWRFGSTVIRRSIAEGRVRLEAKVDCQQAELPTLRGYLRLEGEAARGFEAGEAAGTTGHRWGVVAGHATGDVELETEGVSLTLSGHGYHDRNWAPKQLDQLGIASWTWLRASSAERTLVLYLLQSESGGPERLIGRWLERSGEVRTIEPACISRSGSRRDRYGVRMAEKVTVTEDSEVLTLTLAPPVERGPFYLRSAVSDAAGGWRGWAETVVPKRIDRALERPLVRMAVHLRRGGNSFWLPLFAGLRRSRIARLFRRRSYAAGAP